MPRSIITHFMCASRRERAIARFELEPTREVWELVRTNLVGAGADSSAAGGVGSSSGEFVVSPTYPGCAGCGAGSFVRCGSCAQLSCWSGGRWFSCPWCGGGGEVTPGVRDVTRAD